MNYSFINHHTVKARRQIAELLNIPILKINVNDKISYTEDGMSTVVITEEIEGVPTRIETTQFTYRNKIYNMRVGAYGVLFNDGNLKIFNNHFEFNQFCLDIKYFEFIHWNGENAGEIMRYFRCDSFEVRQATGDLRVRERRRGFHTTIPKDHVVFKDFRNRATRGHMPKDKFDEFILSVPIELQLKRYN
jgi:hypothetical protein